MKNFTDEQWSERLREHAEFERSCDLNCDLSERPYTASEALGYAVQYGSIYCLNVALQYCGGDFYHIDAAVVQAARNDNMHAVETLVEWGCTQYSCSEALQAACINRNYEMIECLWEASDPNDALNFLSEYMPSAARVLQEVIDRKNAEQQKRLLEAAVTVWDGSSRLKRKM